MDEDLEIRMKAADLAVLVMGEHPNALLLASYIVFFESYLSIGMDETEKQMRLFHPRGKGKLKLISGRKLEGVSNG